MVGSEMSPVRETGRSAARICVADASDTVTLLDSERLTVVRRWTMPGKITSGPVVRGTGILCVVDGKRLVRMAPDRDEWWEYAMVSNIVGVPDLMLSGPGSPRSGSWHIRSDG